MDLPTGRQVAPAWSPRERARRVAGVGLRWAAAVILVDHGLIHATGVTLLWRRGEPGTLRYGDAYPAAGSVPAIVSGVVWAIAGLLFVVAAGLLVARNAHWLAVSVVAALVSSSVMLLMAEAAPMGLALNAGVLVAGGTTLVARRRRLADRRGPVLPAGRSAGVTQP